MHTTTHRSETVGELVLDEARQLRARGWSCTRLGEHFGVHPETVRRNLQRDSPM